MVGSSIVVMGLYGGGLNVVEVLLLMSVVNLGAVAYLWRLAKREG
jgi:hypothetical protein